LLELLVSLAILGLLVTLLYGGFSQISRYSLDVQQSLSARQELRLLMKMVLDDLQSVQYFEKLIALNGDANDGVSTFETGIKATLLDGPDGPETATSMHFHIARSASFFPEWREQDPGIHEVGYRLKMNDENGSWELLRREDFYVDTALDEGGREYVLTDRVRVFEVEFLEQEIQLADGGTQENWVRYWDTEEGDCASSDRQNSFCLPRALRLRMVVEREDGRLLEDVMAINLCVRPCKPEVFE
jgi:type II secretory pathway pseudopilin PulG